MGIALDTGKTLTKKGRRKEKEGGMRMKGEKEGRKM